jgi:hypothetical protein
VPEVELVDKTLAFTVEIERWYLPSLLRLISCVKILLTFGDCWPATPDPSIGLVQMGSRPFLARPFPPHKVGVSPHS